MDTNQLVKLLGYSHKDETTNGRLTNIGFKITAPNSDFEGVPFMVDFLHDRFNINLQFNGYKYFKNKFGEPRKCIEAKPQELILYQVRIDNRDGSLPTNVIFPFQLKSTFKKSDVLALIRKGYDYILNHIYDHGDCLNFIYEEYKVEVSFSEKDQIDCLYISLIETEEKIRRKLELELDFQIDNFKSSNSARIASITDPIPKLDWSYQSDLGAQKSKALVGEIFINLKKKLLEFTEGKNPRGIYYSVKDAILELNKAEDMGLVIDTLEREILCDDIESLVEATGFDSYEIDITEKWRKW